MSERHVPDDDEIRRMVTRHYWLLVGMTTMAVLALILLGVFVA